MAISKIYLIHQTYTRIGYTDHQETVVREHLDLFDDVLEICDATKRKADVARFRWTCDASGPLLQWLRQADDDKVAAFVKMAQSGRIEVTALPFHFTPLPTHESLTRYLYNVKDLRAGDIPIRCAMSVGVNGVASALIDLLAQCEVPYLSLAIDEFRGKSPSKRPGAFWWESKTGARLLTWNGLPLDMARELGVGDESVEDARRHVLELTKALEADGYLYDFLVLPVPTANPPANQGVDASLGDFIQAWNKEADDDAPTMEFALPSVFFDRLREKYSANLPVRRGEWNDWWGSGVGSTARATAVQRQSHHELNDAERFASNAKEPPFTTDDARDAYLQLSLYDEHTWGSKNSVDDPYGLDTEAQAASKSGFAYDAARQSRKLRKAAVAAIASEIQADQPGVAVFNPHSWTRTAFVQWNVTGVDTSAGFEDITTGTPTPKWVTDSGVSFVAPDLPPLGYKVFRWAERASFPDSALTTEGTTIENRFYKLVVDEDTGAVRSWHDKELDRELVDSRSPFSLGQFIHERLNGDANREALMPNGNGGRRRPPQLTRESPTFARVRSGRQSPLAASLVSEYIVEGCRRVTQEVILYEHHKWVDVTYSIDKLPVTDPESGYIVFPFFIPGCETRYESAAGAVRVEDELLPNTCRDWVAIQGWVHFSNDAFGVTVASPDAPLAQFGRINTGRWLTEFDPASAHFYSWVYNNHWPTNFPAEQSGELRFRYRLTSHEGEFDAAAAWRTGREAESDAAVETITENASGNLPAASCSFLSVEPDHVIVSGFKRADDGLGHILRLREIAGRDAVARIRYDGTTDAVYASPIEEDRDGFAPIYDGAISCRVPANGLVTLRLSS